MGCSYGNVSRIASLVLRVLRLTSNISTNSYNEDSTGNIPPPIGLFSVDEGSEDAETIHQQDLDIVLDQGWDESPPQSRNGFGSGYSTPSEQRHSRPAPPPKLYSLSDAPLMQNSLSSSSHLTSTHSLNSPSSPQDPFHDMARSPSPLISVESTSYQMLDESVGSTSSAVEPLNGSHARQRSLSSSPQTSFNSSYGQPHSATSPTRSRGGHDYDSTGRRLV